MGTFITNASNNPQIVASYHPPNNGKCRLCLASFDTMIELFSDDAIRMKIYEKLEEFCHIIVSRDDVAPKTICFTCLNEVNRFSDFYKRVQDNQKLLKVSCKFRETAELVVNESETVDADESSDIRDGIIVEYEEIDEIEEVDEGLEAVITETEVITENEEVDDVGAECEFECDPEIDQILKDDGILSASPRQHFNSCESVDPIESELGVVEGPETENPVSEENQKVTEDADRQLETIAENYRSHLNRPEIICGDDAKRRAKHRIALDKPICDFFQLVCDRCQISFQTFQDIKNHMMQNHDEQFFVVCCNRRLNRRDAVMEHISSHVDPKKFTCHICNQVCKSKVTLKTHLKQHIPKEQQPFACEKCGFRFALKTQLKSHMNTHLTNEEKRFVCDQCGKAFAFKFVLEKHKKRMHIRQRNYMCEICARSFIDKVNLKAHERVHDTSTPRLECPKCNALLKNKKTLTIHMRVHSPSQFECEFCSKVFPTKNGLVNHVQYYHTDKKYPCETCGRVFKKSLNLKEHMATHTGEVLYKCEYCDKNFNAKANRYAHVKKAHPSEWADKQKLRYRIENGGKDSE